MIRVLVLIAVAGFLAGVVALAGVAAFGGPELAARNWRWLILDHDAAGTPPLIRRPPAAKPSMSARADAWVAPHAVLLRV